MKPEPPQYPRPIPRIDLDEAPILTNTIVYSDTLEILDDEIDGQAKERAAKRRRIEEAAVSYLRGEELFIFSASLRGPFEQGWRNPWRGTQQISCGQISPLTSGDEVEFNTCQSRNLTTDSNGVLVPRIGGNEVDEEAESRKVGNAKLFDKIVNERKQKTKDGTVEKWLKRTEDMGNHQRDTVNTPTPLRRRSRTHGKRSASPLVWKSKIKASARSLQTVTHQEDLKSGDNAILAHSRLQSVLAQGEHSPRLDKTNLKAVDHYLLTDSSNPERNEKTFVRSNEAKSSLRVARTKRVSRVTNIEENDASEQPLGSPQRNTNLMVHKSSDHPEGQTTDSRKQGTERLKHDGLPDKEDNDVSANQVTTISRTAEQQTFQRHIPPPLFPSNDRPTTSTVMSEVTTPAVPPSAQKRSDLLVSMSTPLDCRPLNEPADSTDQFLNCSSALNANPISEERQAVLNATDPLSKIEYEPDQAIHQHIGEADATLSEEDQQKTDIRAEGESERDAINNTAMDVQNPPSVLKIPNLNQQLDLATSERRTTSEGKGKKRMFADDHGPNSFPSSIKNVLKVRKSTASAPLTASVSLESKNGSCKQEHSDVENHYHDSAPKNISRLSLSGSQAKSGGALRGILKNSNNQNSSQEPLGGSQRSPRLFGTSSSLKQEAQGQQRMRFTTGEDNIVITGNVDETFDLNNAIDDLGSFLSSWDTEKEISGMGDIL